MVRTKLGALDAASLDAIGKQVFGALWGGGGGSIDTSGIFGDAAINVSGSIVGAPDQAMVQPTSRTVMQSAGRIAAGMNNPLSIASMAAPKAAPSLFTSFQRSEALNGGGGASAPAPVFSDALGVRSASGGGGVPLVAWVAGGLVLAAAAVAVVVKRKKRAT